MANDENIQKALTAKFPVLAGKIRIQRERRIWIETPADAFENVLSFLVKEQGFDVMCTITGLDEGENFSMIYHIAQATGNVVNLKVSIPKSNPVWNTVLPYFAGCAIYERELIDLLGIQIQGLPEGHRYPLPDDWPSGEHPLRKDWKPGQSTAKKEGVQ